MEISEEERTYILEVSKAVRNSCDISILVALNIFFALTAIVGNFMILAALCKQCSLHPPCKILFRSLALADVFVGILSGPALRRIPFDDPIRKMGVRSIL